MRTPRKDANIVDAPDGLVSDCQSVIAEWKRHASPPQESISRHCLKINTPPALEEAVPSPLVNPFPPLPFSVCSTNKPSPTEPGILCNQESSNAIHCHDSAKVARPVFRALKWRICLGSFPMGTFRQRCANTMNVNGFGKRGSKTLFSDRERDVFVLDFYTFSKVLHYILKQFWNGKIC